MSRKDLDNSDLKFKVGGVGDGGLFDSKTKLEERNAYLKNLILEAQIANLEGNNDEITINGKQVSIKNLVGKEDEHSRFRKIAISQLNQLDDDKLRVFFGRYQVDNIMDLSSEIANFMIDRTRKEKTFDATKGWFA